MTTDDDDLERRLRGALGRPRPTDRVDAEDFLARVHHGAKVRRVKRGVGTAVAGVLVIAGGGLAINASGYLNQDPDPVADGPTFTAAPPTTYGTFSTAPPSTQSSQTKQSTATTVTPSNTAVSITSHGPIAAKDVKPISLTATGTAKQFVLAKTPGNACARPACATVFATTDHGTAGSWTDVGQLPAPPPVNGVPTPQTVSQLRFTLRQDGSGTYDGWAFGNALWSTHDSGQSWTDASPGGSVTQLEAWGAFVYAGVSSGVVGDDTATLYRSSTSADDWTPVEVSKRGLTSVQSLAAADGLVGLIDARTDGHTKVFISATGESGSWQGQGGACPAGTDPTALSAASGIEGQEKVSSLWVTCQGLTSSVVRYTNTAALGTWHDITAKGLSATALVAAQSPAAGIVAGTGQLSKISIQQGPMPVVASSFGVPVYLGFTNDSHGYLIDADGTILSTIDGGDHWAPYTISDTP